MYFPAMEFPARVTLLSGAIVWLTNASQMDALPLGASFEANGLAGLDKERYFPDAHLYQEVQPTMAGEAKRLSVELQAAAVALALADRCMKEGHLGPMKVQQVHQAAERATAALEAPVVA
jgi:hypothetical protein